MNRTWVRLREYIMAAEKKNVSLGMAGLIVVCASVFAGGIASQALHKGRYTLAASSIVTLVGVITGIVLIVMHFTRGRRQ